MVVAADKPRREWRLTKLLRLGVYCAVVSLGLGLVAARSVYGDVKASALSIGHELGKMGDVGTGRPLRLNGEIIHVGTTTEDLPVATVLDRAEAGCASTSAGIAGEIASLPESLRKRIPAGTRASGVLREDHGDRGVVACLVRDDGMVSTGMKESVARLAAMMSTGDLGQVGKLRYVFAESTATGRTHVVAAWTDGPFNLYAMLPEAGHDAPGSDPADAPRPPGAQRILSADIDGVPYGVRLYETARSPSDVIAVYDAEMPSRGWERLHVGGDPETPGPAGGAAPGGEDQRVFSRPGSDLLVITGTDAGRTVVTLIEMRGK